MIKTYPTLYKKTATGAIQIWYQEQDNEKYWTVSGQQHGQKVTSAPTIAQPKNVGRSNATTAVEQATSEIKANYEKKLAQGGYHEKIEDVDKSKYFKPMLAYDVEKKPIKNWDQVIWSQPKLDGIRCIATIDGLWSRTGKPIVSVPHIHEALHELFKEYPDAVLDGEIYADKFSDDFNEIISLARKTKPSPIDLIMSLDLQYHVYDFPSFGDFPYSERLRQLKTILKEQLQIPDSFLCIVETKKVLNEEEKQQFLQDYMEKGYEGQILRIDSGSYENKRSKFLLKDKEFKTEEFTIKDIEEGIGNRAGMAGNVVCLTKDGREFRANIRGNRDQYRQYLTQKDRYKGGQATIRFFNYTPDGIPRFGVVIEMFPDGRDL